MCDGAGIRRDLMDVLSTVCQRTQAPSDRYRARVWHDPTSGQSALLVLDSQQPNCFFTVVAKV